jgi:hypothetical protein
MLCSYERRKGKYRMRQTEVRELRIQTASTGDIWAISWLDPHPRRVAGSIEEFVQSSIFQDSTSAALVALPTNVGLITEIYLQKRTDADYSMWVASPALVTATKPDRIDPVSVLEASCKIDPHLSPSLGGWHQFGKEDYPAYALAEMVSRGGTISAQAIQLLKAHPVWPALSFISGLNLKMCCRLLSIILDPRWYVDLKQPARTARLESYLGLSLRVQRSALDMLQAVDGDKQKKSKLTKTMQAAQADGFMAGMSAYDARMIERCTAVQYCWWKDPEILTCPDKGFAPGVPLLEAPGGFLWRIWFSHGKNPKGYLRTSQQFIRFLRDAWLDAIYVNTVGDGLFVPSYFFKHDYEQLAFMQHKDQFDSTRG